MQAGLESQTLLFGLNVSWTVWCGGSCLAPIILGDALCGQFRSRSRPLLHWSCTAARVAQPCSCTTGSGAGDGRERLGHGEKELLPLCLLGSATESALSRDENRSAKLLLFHDAVSSALLPLRLLGSTMRSAFFIDEVGSATDEAFNEFCLTQPPVATEA
jgi:hypothetical protein